MDEQQQPTLQQENKTIEKPKRHEDEEIRVRCPYCGNRFARRNTIIRNIKEACFLCTFCGRRIK